MLHTCNIRTARAALGAALLTLFAACSDVPSGPSRRLPDLKPELPVPGVADRPLVEGTAINVQPGERRTSRVVRRADGHLYRVDVARSADGLAREMSVSRDGVPVVRVLNDWRTTPAGHLLTRQRLLQFPAAAQPVVFDTKARGGVEAILGSSVLLPARPLRPPQLSSLGDVSPARRSLARVYEFDPSSGPCDQQERNAESALEDWLLSVAGVAGATMTGNAWATWTAYAYQLKKWRDLGRADTALDACVESAGRRPDDEL